MPKLEIFNFVKILFSLELKKLVNYIVLLDEY